MDYGTVAGTGILPATGLGISLATGLWLPVALLAIAIAGVVLVRLGFRRGRAVDDF